MSDIQQFDFTVNVMQALLWQYNKAENLTALIQNKQDWYNVNQEQFWEDWFTNVFTLETADDFGCSVWGVILDQPLSTNIPAPPTGSYIPFGFGSFNKNFHVSNFLAQNGRTVQLNTAQKRIILQLKYFKLVTSGTVPEINRFLKYVFRDYGKVYLLDNGRLQQTYVFKFNLDPSLRSVIKNFDLLPRPAGVKSSILINSRVPFGFGPFNRNFYNSNFLPSE